MGLTPSTPLSPPGPTSVITTPLQRNPTLDGASGLHYSGRIYTNPFQKLGAGVCDGTGTVSPDKIGDVMPGSISSTSLPQDDSTHRISEAALQTYIQGLVQSGRIPPSPLNPSDESSLEMDAQFAADRNFYQFVQGEYCFYETRYKTALDNFLNLAASASSPASQVALDSALAQTVALNSRLNSLLEIVNYVANDRATKVNQRSPQINAANAGLQEKIAKLREQQEFLMTSDTKIRTQEEMVRFSAEKNQAMNIQIAFFVALDIIALGTIIAVYRSVRG